MPISDLVHGTALIDLAQTAVGGSSFGALVIVQDVANAVIDWGNGNSLRLRGVLAVTLDSGDFVFVSM